MRQVSQGAAERGIERVMEDARLERYVTEPDPYEPDRGLEGPALDFALPAFVQDLIAGLLVVLLVALVVWALVRWVRGPRAQRAEALAEGELEDPMVARERWIAKQLAAARAAEARGDWHAALRGYWGALVVGLGQTRLLAFRPGWTCREMLERTQVEGSAVAGPVAELLPRVERMEFGGAPVAASDVREVAGLCEAHLAARWLRQEGAA